MSEQKIQVNLFCAGKMQIFTTTTNGDINIHLDHLVLHPPAGTYHLSDEEKEELYDVLSKAIFETKQIVNKINKRIIDGVPE